MGGFKVITGYRITAFPPKGKCVFTKTNMRNYVTKNGVHLGQNIKEFEKSIPIEFKYNKSELTHESFSKRKATKDELKKIHARWPKEKQDYYDVTIIIKARFTDNRLVDFYVQKIESF
jgi:hypothetical protein